MLQSTWVAGSTLSQRKELVSIFGFLLRPNNVLSQSTPGRQLACVWLSGDTVTCLWCVSFCTFLLSFLRSFDVAAQVMLNV